MKIQLLTVAQACDRLAVSRTTLNQLIADGRIESVKIGRARRIPEASLARFVQAQLRSKVVA